MGKLFQPGQSGNPGGRPKVPADVKQFLEGGVTFEAVRFQYETMLDPKAPWPVRVRCAELLADRGLGKPAQSVNVEGTGGGIVVVLKDDMEGV